MQVNYKGYSIESRKISGALSKADYKGLAVWFSYNEPIAICYPERAIISSADFSSTTSSHISKVKKLYHDLEIISYEDFESKMIALLSGNWK